MKHTTKLLTVLATVIAVFSLTGCPHPVNDNSDTHEHIWELVEEVKPTCTTKGTKTYKCKLCEETKVEEVSALGHTWVEDENHSCHYKCHCGATKVQHTFIHGGCKCGTYEFDDYQLEIEIYENNVSKNVKTSEDEINNAIIVDTVYFSFNESTLSNYEEIEFSEEWGGELDEYDEEILIYVITVNLNKLILRKTSYNIIDSYDITIQKGQKKTVQVLVE